MKKLVLSILALSLSTALLFTGCTKDEEEVVKSDKELVSETILDGRFGITAMVSDPAWMMSDSSLVTDLFAEYLYECEQTSEYNFKSTDSELAGFKKMTLIRGDGYCGDLTLDNRNRDGKWKLDDSKGYVELYFNYVPGDDTDALDVPWKVESYTSTRVVLSQNATSEKNPTAKKWTLTLTKK